MILTGDMKVRMIRDPIGMPVRAAGWDLELSGMPGFRFFVDKRDGCLADGTWSVTELTSGARVVTGFTRLDAIERAESILAKIGRERFARRVADVTLRFNPLGLEELETDDGC